MKKEIINSADAPNPTKPYLCQAVRVDSFIFTSGLNARDVSGALVGAGDVRVQTKKTIENMRAVLRSAGADLENVVKLTFYLRNMEDFEKVAEIRLQYFKTPTASTTVGVQRLTHPDMLVEIDSIAVMA
jgi:2-iminobutanoate/2-iminopropanoate deaminase